MLALVFYSSVGCLYSHCASVALILVFVVPRKDPSLESSPQPDDTNSLKEAMEEEGSVGIGV